MKIDVAGVLIDNMSKVEAIQKIADFVQSGQPHYAVTPYSEMIVFAQKDSKYREALNSADLSLADGIGVMWGAKFLGSKLQERITGRKFIFDIAQLATQKNYSLALIGGQDNVAPMAAENLKKYYPSLKINLALSDLPFDDSIIQKINQSNSDILLIGYSPPKQELWLFENYIKLNSKLSLGLGGTFDYLAGKRATPPNFMHQMGLEWLWRLITQPWRIKRIWNAVIVFTWKIIIYKFKHHAG